MDWIGRNSAQLRLAVRITTAAVVSYVACHLLGLMQSQWAVLTAVIVMQASVGGSLKAMLDRFMGSLGGAIWGVAVSLSLHHSGFAPLGVALAVGVGPLAVLAAIKPTYRVAPVTAIILLLSQNLNTLGPVDSAIQRMLEIGIGSIVALGVSLVVLPARAHRALAQATSQALGAMADLMTIMPTGLQGHNDPQAMLAAHDRIRTFIGKAETAAEEALRERSSYLTTAPDPVPICRTLRRLRHDLAILGRAMTEPLPEGTGAIILAPTVEAMAAIAAFFRVSAAAFAQAAAPPALSDLDGAFVAQAMAVTQMRRAGATHALPDDDLGRIFGLGFALEQLHLDLQDLVDRGAELARPAPPAPMRLPEPSVAE
jgi:uncharacterized membrane protein YccC